MSKSKVQTQKQQNLSISEIINCLPDGRAIRSLQIVEQVENCPKDFHPIYKTYDQDNDADLWGANFSFGKKSSRFLCLSKSEGIQNFVLEQIKVISEKELAPKGFSYLQRTADTEQKAWKKKQIVYKLSNSQTVIEPITDIILCSNKFKTAPEGFKLAGEINSLLIFYLCSKQNSIEKQIENLKLQQKKLYPGTQNDEHYYEQLQLISPIRPAPTIPTILSPLVRAAPQAPFPCLPYSQNENECHNIYKTLSHYTQELCGIPFQLHPSLSKKIGTNSMEIPSTSSFVETSELDYDFQLERQILCTTKTANSLFQSTNPFFQ